MRLLVVADRAGDVPAPARAADVAAAWRDTHPGDEVATLALADGGAGLLDAIAGPSDTWLTTEAAGPHGHPVEAAVLLRADGTAVVEAARVASAAVAPDGRVDVQFATTYGVGELVQAALDTGAHRVAVGVAGVAAVDGGAGALTGMGFRLRVADGSGLKIGVADLDRVRTVERGWAEVPDDLEVVVLADTDAALAQAAAALQHAGEVDAAMHEQIAAALAAWGPVAERDLDAAGAAGRDGAGAGGGLAFGLAAALHAVIRPAVEVVAGWQGLDPALAAADGVLVAAAPDGPVHRYVTDRAVAAGVPVVPGPPGA